MSDAYLVCGVLTRHLELSLFRTQCSTSITCYCKCGNATAFPLLCEQPHICVWLDATLLGVSHNCVRCSRNNRNNWNVYLCCNNVSTARECYERTDGVAGGPTALPTQLNRHVTKQGLVDLTAATTTRKALCCLPNIPARCTCIVQSHTARPSRQSD